MRMMMIVRIPAPSFNASVREGTAGDKIGKILEETNPEAVYFTAIEGMRTGVMIVNLDNESQIPFYAEPWFLEFDAEVELYPTMTPQDLANAGLDQLGRTWG